MSFGERPQLLPAPTLLLVLSAEIEGQSGQIDRRELGKGSVCFGADVRDKGKQLIVGHAGAIETSSADCQWLRGGDARDRTGPAVSAR